jgi:hypothetical protein
MLREAGFDPLYIPHGIETSVFKPIQRREARQALGWSEEGFIAGIVGTTKGYPARKYFDGQIRAFAAFHKRHPDSRLYLHTDLTSIGATRGRTSSDLSLWLAYPTRPC